jgi:hypothetical protein
MGRRGGGFCVFVLTLTSFFIFYLFSQFHIPDPLKLHLRDFYLITPETWFCCNPWNTTYLSFSFIINLSLSAQRTTDLHRLFCGSSHDTQRLDCSAKDLEGSCHDPIEVLSQNLALRTEKIHKRTCKESRYLSQKPNRGLPEYEARVLPLR